MRFGTQEIAVVGDRGMIQALGQAALGEANFRYLTTLIDPQVRTLLKAGRSSYAGPTGPGAVRRTATRRPRPKCWGHCPSWWRRCCL